jgi:tRNA pseudouridine38-40 synthase
VELNSRNFKLTIAYDGTSYLGWQKTKEGPSIEAALQQPIEQIVQHSVSLQAASRTDAGVHADGQVVNFFTTHAILPERLQISLNQLLPKDIAVVHIEEAHPSFHPTLDCWQKEYHYSLCVGKFQRPQRRLYSWHYPHVLDLKAMQASSEYFLGTHDFSTFCNSRKGLNYKDYRCTLNSLEIIPCPENSLLINIQGNRFLYNMVRNIVGTLVYVGIGKISEKEIPAIIASHDRTLAGVTAPAHGLTLHQVSY